MTCTLDLHALPVRSLGPFRAFLAARGPSTSVKKYSKLYFFTPVRSDVLIVWVVWDPAQTTHHNIPSTWLKVGEFRGFEPTSSTLRIRRR